MGLSAHLSVALSAVVMVLAATTLIGVYVYGSDLHDKANNIRNEQQRQQQSAVPAGHLPRSFVLPDAAITPVKNQMSRGTCWVFSTIGVIESSYRKNGIDKGFLAADEYVSFSEQAYGIGMVRYCGSHPEDRFCFAGPAQGTTEDGEPEWLYYMGSKVAPYVLPTAVCPYTPTDDGELTCDGIDKAVSTNPISFKARVKSVQSVYTIDDIKQLLYEKQVALAWSHAVFDATYSIPCDDNQTTVYHTQQCITCAHPCSTSSTGCCAEMVLNGYTKQGVFGLHKYPHVSGGHAMMVVGWNDNFRVDTGLPGQMHERTTGGLIIKNSWGTDLGHSAAYWAQKHSLADENFICPLEASSSTWIPVNATCMAERKDALACSSGLEKIVQKNWVKGATVLNCTARAANAETARRLGWTGCRAGMHYALVSQGGEVKTTAPAGSDGYVRFHLVEWNPKDSTQPVQVVQTGAMTWGGLEMLLRPISIIGNTEQCGFFFVPYDTFSESTVRFPAEGHDTPVVSYIELEWDDASYAAKRSKANGKDYSLLQASTKKMKLTKFAGPFDWNADI
eukprot:m51a1_g7023 hypothetical protein (562) ;mRNA; r:47042-49335